LRCFLLHVNQVDTLSTSVHPAVLQLKRWIHRRISISFAVRNLRSNRIAQLFSGISIAQENRWQCFFNRKSFKWIYRVWLYQSERIDIATWRGFSSMLLNFFLGLGFAEKI